MSLSNAPYDTSRLASALRPTARMESTKIRTMSDMKMPNPRISTEHLPNTPSTQAKHTWREELVLLKQRQPRSRVRLLPGHNLGLLGPAPHVHMHRPGKLGLVRLELVRIRKHHDGIIPTIKRLQQLTQLIICFRASAPSNRLPGGKKKTYHYPPKQPPSPPPPSP